jgi:hypothetical protein
MGTAHLAFVGERWGAVTSPEMTGSCITAEKNQTAHITIEAGWEHYDFSSRY